MADLPPRAKPKKKPHGPLMCPYCTTRAAVFHPTSSAFYGNGRDYGPLWACTPCGAWVGCHPGTTTPLGRLADKELRQAKSAAHAAFDRLWQAKQQREGISKGRARGAGYGWLARQLGIAPKECHIGMMDVTLCRRVVEVCAPFHNARAPVGEPPCAQGSASTSCTTSTAGAAV